MRAGGRNPEGIRSTETSFGDSSDHPRKRSRVSDCVSVVTDEKQTQKTFTKRRTQDRRLWLACPYAKKDPVRYRDCYRYFLGRIRDVKQHLTRCHRKPIYCPICNDTFEDEDEKDSHIRSRTCTPNSSIMIEGISEKQKRELSQRVSSKMPEEQQWFAVFDTLFHPHPHPRTPYRDRELSEDLCVFQDFLTARGPNILAEVLESKGVLSSSLPHEERDLAAFKEEILEEGLNLIIDQWTNESATAGGEADVPHSSPPPSTDSAIAMQVDRPETVNEICTAKTESGLDCRKQTPAPFRLTEPAGFEADVLHTGGASDFGFELTVDRSATQSTSMEAMSIDPGHHGHVSETPAASQLMLPSDLNVLFSADKSLDLFDFDPGWPT
ncbi:hypothetical protein GGR52DRAFT_578317 [Hypoxylon sp. FL1284]|nr:hypothetical protein GGR52DRAFT_578317 [Hypoxylon sp. FL1284]